MILSNSSSRIRHIYKTYYQDKAEEKALHIYNWGLDFLEDCEGMDQYEAEISPAICMRLSEAYFIDIIKYKEYHLNPKSISDDENYDESLNWDKLLHHEGNENLLNGAKRAALTIKWLIRGAPITLTLKNKYKINNYIPSEEQYDKLWYANDLFAIEHGVMLLGIRFSSLDKGYKNQLYKDMLYHIKYRNFCDRHFIIIFENMLGVNKEIFKRM